MAKTHGQVVVGRNRPTGFKVRRATVRYHYLSHVHIQPNQNRTEQAIRSDSSPFQHSDVIICGNMRGADLGRIATAAAACKPEIEQTTEDYQPQHGEVAEREVVCGFPGALLPEKIGHSYKLQASREACASLNKLDTSVRIMDYFYDVLFEYSNSAA